MFGSDGFVGQSAPGQQQLWLGLRQAKLVGPAGLQRLCGLLALVGGELPQGRGGQLLLWECGDERLESVGRVYILPGAGHQPAGLVSAHLLDLLEGNDADLCQCGGQSVAAGEHDVFERGNADQ